MINWVKKGLIFKPESLHPLASTRVMVPTPFLLNESLIRLYCGFCDSEGISRIAYLDLDAEDPQRIMQISDSPVLDIGEDGTFDDNGLCPASIVRVSDSVVYLYYFGFQKGIQVPFYMFSGLAISTDNAKTFKRFSRTPILDRSNDEFLMRSCPSVIYDSSIKKFKMWYPAGSTFMSDLDKPVHKYHLRYLESDDGINWGKIGSVVLRTKNSDEYGLGRPFYFKYQGREILFFSSRTHSLGYRIGGAFINENYLRIDESLNFNVTVGDWDSEMLCYASFLDYKDRVYCFYNGNGLGQTGVGYSLLSFHLS